MRPLDLLVVTFNCGRSLVDVETFASSLVVDGDGVPDLICLSLQEVAPIAHSFLGGALLAPYFRAVKKAVAPTHELVHLVTHNVGLTAIMVFVKADLSLSITSLQTGEVGIGWADMGNKGAAAVRIAFKSGNMAEAVPLTLVAAHLAPGEDQCERRNTDWQSIVRRLAFKSPHKTTPRLSAAIPPAAAEDELPLLGQPPPQDSLPTDTISPIFTSGSPVFLAGDLNYRTGDTSPTPGSPSQYPQPQTSASDPVHFSHALSKDQLNRERKAGRTLHMLQERPIDFAPTYKLSPKQQETMSRAQYLVGQEPPIYHWASHRLPSWCDRILYSAQLDDDPALKIRSYTSLSIQPTSDHRPVALRAKLDLEAAAKVTAQQSSPFEMDGTWRTRQSAARRREIVVGVGAYLTLTWEGRLLLAASAVGLLGGWLMLSSLLAAGY